MKCYLGLFVMLSWGIQNAVALAEIDFVKEVLPVLQDRCLKCHQYPYIDKKSGKLKKPKADLLLESAESIMKGAEDGPVVVPGEAKESSLYTLIALPEDDDDIMPPKGDPLTPEQISAIKQWINDGADFGGWVGKTEAPPVQ